LPKPKALEKNEAPQIAASVVTDEDLALERELERMAENTPPEISEGFSENRISVARDDNEMLAHHVSGVKPAATIAQLRDQVFHAKQTGCNSIEATPELIRYYTKPNYPTDDAPYFSFDGIKVWRPDMFEKHKQMDGMSVEQRMAFKRKLAEAKA
jgi:hypothetical protein